jgi:hypothetical protein
MTADHTFICNSGNPIKADPKYVSHEVIPEGAGRIPLK